MTITQAVDIPASHRLTIDVPREIPAGRAVIAIFASTPKNMSRSKARLSDRERIERAIKNAEKGENLITFESAEQAMKVAEELAAMG
jgi:hypothetical protein